MKKVIISVFLVIAVVVLAGCQLLPQQSDQLTNSDVNTPDQVVITDSKSLNLSGQGLAKVSMDVFSKTSLEELDISNNQLTGAIPAEIRHLSNLKILDLSNNQMTDVPAEIGQLSKLEVLDLSNNQLTGLPNELGNLKNLKVLNLSGNQYSEQDLVVIRQGLSSQVQIITN